MILDAKIHILDIDSSESIQDTITRIFWKYGYRIQHDDLFTSSIDFSKLNIKIKDWTGWTQLLKIKAIKTNSTGWIQLSSTDKNLSNTLTMKCGKIAVYNKYISTQGFHGEIKYKFAIQDCQYIKNNDKVCMRILVPYQEEWQMFSDMEVEQNVVLPTPELVGYEIYTKSGFYNANGIHLCSADAKVEGGEKSWK